MMLQQGTVIKAYSNYYYVQTDSQVTMCTLRGRFKKERFSLLVGDRVDYVGEAAGKGVIEAILPRRSMLRRPMVANVDQVALTFAAARPDISPILLDRFLVLAEISQLTPTIIINKMDLAAVEPITALATIYRRIGYQVILLSVRTGSGLKELHELLQDRITVFSGPSGVGKSTILNAVEPGLSLVTGDISAKIGRGKHTTRHAQLLALTGGGFVVDTPGLGFTEFADIEDPQLMHCFPEIAAMAVNCRFSSFLHRKEPQCAVKQAVAEGLITPERYASYLAILAELTTNKKGF
jgi:ribosome biogenesis GTPase / thiamine phosphate phosphatase